MRTLATVLFSLCLAVIVRSQYTEPEARLWVEEYNQNASKVYEAYVTADWAYNTNITDYNSDQLIEVSGDMAEFDKASGEEANKYDYENFQDQTLAREFGKIADLGYSVLSEQDYDTMSQLGAQMTGTYSTATVCNRPGDVDNICYPLEPDLEAIMASSTDWDELVWAWEGWRNESGRKMPDDYEQYAGLLNKAAVMNGYADNGEYWRSWYEMSDFREVCESLWASLRPLYEQLHAYVRRKLQAAYPTHTFPSSGHIPAHILGNMWAQSWSSLEDLMKPYPNKTSMDVTDRMIENGYNVTTMFLLAEDFFDSLGMPKMPQEFWDHSMLEKPTDGREVVCHASAWDFYNGVDFRIKQCTEVTHDWLITTHHEMGHVEYFLEYMNQPIKFKDGANPGFHEAVGDLISLSVSTVEHMQEIGLMDPGSYDPEVDMNFLMAEALKKLAFIPFGYLIDQWRWDLFNGTFSREEYNSAWWDARCLYQGLYPPVTRSAGNDFDAGAKFHVPANTPYVRYFISHILQYQFHEALCNAAGNVLPLHRCDVYGSAEAGQLLSDMLALGSSVPWPDAMEAITGQREMSVQPLIDYFQPLLDWLTEQNQGFPVGWTNECPPDVITSP